MTSTADEVWFRDAFEEYRRPLHAHCYRLAGNVADADDLVQETFLRGWRCRTQYEGRASIRTWLYRIATNVYLDHRKAAARRSVPVGDPMEWCTDIGPYPDALLGEDPPSDLVARETVELALIAALMYLPPRQRAAFVLRDVSGWTSAEIAAALGLAVPAVNSLIQRARKTLRHYAPGESRQWRRPALTWQRSVRRHGRRRSQDRERQNRGEQRLRRSPPRRRLRHARNHRTARSLILKSS